MALNVVVCISELCNGLVSITTRHHKFNVVQRARGYVEMYFCDYDFITYRTFLGQIKSATTAKKLGKPTAFNLSAY